MYSNQISSLFFWGFIGSIGGLFFRIITLIVSWILSLVSFNAYLFDLLFVLLFVLVFATIMCIGQFYEQKRSIKPKLNTIRIVTIIGIGILSSVITVFLSLNNITNSLLSGNSESLDLHVYSIRFLIAVSMVFFALTFVLVKFHFEQIWLAIILFSICFSQISFMDFENKSIELIWDLLKWAIYGSIIGIIPKFFEIVQFKTRKSR